MVWPSIEQWSYPNDVMQLIRPNMNLLYLNLFYELNTRAYNILQIIDYG